MTSLEPLYVVDTNTLIWYLKQDKKLSKVASDVFDAAERGETALVLSSIALAELFYADQKWKLFSDFEEVYNQILAKPYFWLLEFRPHEVLDLAQDSAVPEMHDRIISGLSRRLNAPILTSDKSITTSGIVKVVW